MIIALQTVFVRIVISVIIIIVLIIITITIMIIMVNIEIVMLNSERIKNHFYSHNQLLFSNVDKLG